MENGQEAPTSKPEAKSDKADQFVNDMFDHAQELLVILRDAGTQNTIKERITCLKYLEEITKTYFILKRASTHDPSAAGSTVRKYATAFSKNATGSGKARGRGRKPATPDPTPALGFDLEGDDGDATA